MLTYLWCMVTWLCCMHLACKEQKDATIPTFINRTSIMSSIMVIMNFSVNRGINQKWLIGWIVFYAVSAIFQTTKNDGNTYSTKNDWKCIDAKQMIIKVFCSFSGWYCTKMRFNGLLFRIYRLVIPFIYNKNYMYNWIILPSLWVLKILINWVSL